jgi:hypothetical protein
MVPLSALEMAKTALYDAMREQGLGRAKLARGCGGASRKSIAFSTCVTLGGWSMLKRRSGRSACA